MADRNIGRSWTSHEDFLLTQAVAVHGENDKWKTVALSVPGRTNKACRKRWLHSLSPSIKKSAWTPDEDRALLDFFSAHPNKWSIIARHIPGRTDDACSKRYREALDPALRKDEWTIEEDDKLMDVFSRLGGKWGQVGREMSRSGLGCRNRWRQLQRKRTQDRPLERTEESPFSRSASLDESEMLLEQSQSSPWSALSILDTTPYWEGQLSPFLGNSPANLSTHLPTNQEDILISQIGSPIPQDETQVLASRTETPPPFQYSSSSLSAALTDPRIPKALPSINCNIPNNVSRPPEVPYDPPPLQPADLVTSGPRQTVIFNDDTVTPMSVDDDLGITNDSEAHPVEETNSHFRGAFSKEGAITDLRTTDIFQGRHTVRSNSAPANPVQTALAHDYFHDNISSTSSTPITFAPVTLSPAASPTLNQSSELPSSGQLFTASVLFTPYYRSIPPPRPNQKKRTDLQGPLRLSSNLVATSDPSVLPYACGHERCWPSDASTSSARYATSRELTEHSKAVHDARPGGDKPYRCALDGCGKSWKSINGLQYHLQISKSHFQQAISSSFSSISRVDEQNPSFLPPDVNDLEPKRRVWSCPHSNCIKQYRQLSGLRYHLAHGHPDDLPAQLEVVPPALARKVAEKMRVRAHSPK